MSTRFACAILACAIIGQFPLRAQEQPAAAWNYVVPTAGEPMEHPPLVPLVLFDKRPELVTNEPAYRSAKPLYGLLRYGSDTSPQVVVVLDERSVSGGGLRDGGELDLYVDAARDPEITARQIAAGEGRLRRAAIKSEIAYLDRVAEEFPRQVLFRRGALGSSLGVATLGYLEGQVTLNGKPVAARRVDGDANGLFSDPRDRLWLDLNADGQWDAFSEQFPVQPVMLLAGKRYAVRTDQAGTRLALEEVTGVGTLKLQLRSLAAGATIRSLEVALMGDDGSAYAARADGAAMTVPAGKYAMRSLRVSLLPADSSKPWTFQFTRYEPPDEGEWQRIGPGEEVTIDPCGQLRLAVEGDELKRPVKPGQMLTIHPRLYTAGGLLINSCDFHEKPAELGDSSHQNSCETSLCQTDGTAVASYSSGFA
ncbi:MAG TPA: hypothetical protein VFB80_00010 [Pirellulaceae bacterium]|nr:hypothetical protein [Pirellulaceae bacterium]